MAVYDLMYEGLKGSGTFHLNSTTATTIEDNPSEIIGKVVCMTGEKEVGYGSADKAPIGWVYQVENYEGKSDELVVSVHWNEMKEDIPCAGTENPGDFLACDGTGGLKTSTTYTGCTAISVDDSANTCIAKFD